MIMVWSCFRCLNPGMCRSRILVSPNTRSASAAAATPADGVTDASTAPIRTRRRRSRRHLGFARSLPDPYPVNSLDKCPFDPAGMACDNPHPGNDTRAEIDYEYPSSGSQG
jgi:hypothetical protein